MRASIAVFLLALGACGGSETSRLPVAPSAPATPPLVSNEPSMSPPTRRGSQPDLGKTIPLGETVRSRVAPDDPLCGEAYPYGCKYFRVLVPQDGVLEITVRWSATQSSPYPLDMDVIGPSGAGWAGEIASGPQRIARGLAAAGATYVIEVWSFLTPHEPFELTTSLRPR